MLQKLASLLSNLSGNFLIHSIQKNRDATTQRNSEKKQKKRRFVEDAKQVASWSSILWQFNHSLVMGIIHLVIHYFIKTIQRIHAKEEGKGEQYRMLFAIDKASVKFWLHGWSEAWEHTPFVWFELVSNQFNNVSCLVWLKTNVRKPMEPNFRNKWNTVYAEHVLVIFFRFFAA